MKRVRTLLCIFLSFAGLNAAVANTVMTTEKGGPVLEIATTLGMEQSEIQLELRSFPNPSQNSVNLIIGDFQSKGLNFQLLDIYGRLIISSDINGKFSSIEMNHLPTGCYILNVTDENALLKTFTIVKN